MVKKKKKIGIYSIKSFWNFPHRQNYAKDIAIISDRPSKWQLIKGGR